jgi:uncharacterized C2H2 Zn-finger protein
MTLRIISTCSICGHHFNRLFDEAEYSAHLGKAHGMFFDPKPLFR